MTMIRIVLQVLFIISISTSISWVPKDPYKCFEHDYPPVDTSATFYDYCKDIHGNIYKPISSEEKRRKRGDRPEYPAQLTSCCECLEYKCTYIHKSKVLYWKTSVSDHCCLACTNTTYKADTVIETIELDDKCQSIETQVCRKLPGHEKAKIESEFNYKACCNDNSGLQVLGTEVYQPSTCSQRTCFYDKYLPFSLWISKQILPGCDCCLRKDPKTGKEYLVADGTTWVVNGKVFECCRGDIVMKTETSTTYSTTHSTTHSTSTHRSLPEDGDVVLITGGSSRTSASMTSAEIFSPKAPGTPCILPDLPVRYYGHTQDGGMICGGYYGDISKNCRKWNPKEEIFPKKPVHEFTPARYQLVSWTPVSGKETILMGGGSPNTGAQSSSTIVKPGIFKGYPGFNLTHPIYGACAVPDPNTDTVVIIGGNLDSPRYRITSLYNEDGWVEDLANLNYQRYLSGCTSYIADKKRIFLVTGGLYSATTEILEDKKWKVLLHGNLPFIIYGLELATVNNQVYAFGGYSKKPYGYLSSIFKFNIDEGRWYNQSYHMSTPRMYFGISVVDFKYYSDACTGTE